MNFVLLRALRVFPSFLLAVGLLALGACSQKQSAAGGPGAFGGNEGDRVTGTPLPERQEGTSFFGPGVQRGQFAPVLFDFDRFDVRPDQEGRVRAVAGALQNGGGSLIVAGFTDARGTAEYNRALGEKRGGAGRRRRMPRGGSAGPRQTGRERLIQLGVAPGRIQTVSFGMEMPVDSGSSEAAYARNRRAEFGLAR